MAVEHVEVDEVGENDRVIAGRIHFTKRHIKQRFVAAGFDLSCYALMCIDVGDFADTDNIPALFHELVEDCGCMWWRGQVPAVSRTDIAVRPVTNKWPCDDASDVVLIHELSRDLA